MTWYTLQSDSVSCLQNTGDGAQCMFDALAASAGGQATFTFIVGGALLLALFLGSDYEPAPVAGAVVLLGGLLVSGLPGQYQGIAQTVVLLGLFAGVWAVGKRYFLQVGR
jgi:hypothetical protein